MSSIKEKPEKNALNRQRVGIENKQDWIKHIREVIQERTIHLKGALKEPIHIPKTAPSTKQKGRRDGEDLDSQGDGSSQPDTISIASRTSQNTLDSDKPVMQCLNGVAVGEQEEVPTTEGPACRAKGLRQGGSTAEPQHPEALPSGKAEGNRYSNVGEDEATDRTGPIQRKDAMIGGQMSNLQPKRKAGL
uniref:Uncharacterized protein n=1 Tax=Sphaerodactylus townsendi TaxID=933632 RepID=A0ACB8FDF2_9SAUR